MRACAFAIALAAALPAQAQKKPRKPAPAAPAPAATPAPPPLDPPALAKRLSEAAGVAELESVWIEASPGTLGLAEALVLEAARRGATALVTYRSPRLERGLQLEAPPDLLARAPALPLLLSGAADVLLRLPSPAEPQLMAGVPEERAAAWRRGQQTVADALGKREMRIVSLGNAAFPGEGLVKLHGGDLAALTRAFWDAVLTEPAELAARAAKVRERLKGNRTVRVTDVRGTDLTLKLASRRVGTTTGAIPLEEAVVPGPAWLWLPAGEVYTVPTEFSAEGRVRLDAGAWRGQLLRDLTLEFREGKLASVSGNGADLLQKALAASDGAKDVFAVLDIGVNPRSRPVPGSTFRSYEMDGMVTLGIGENAWAGGTNGSEFAWYFHLADATVTVDSETLVERGTLKLP